MADDLAALTAARVATTGVRLEYTPDLPAERSGGDLDASGTLARVLPAARSGKEVMLLCVGGEGSMRMGANLVLNLASLGLHHMLLFAPKQEVCEGVWEVLPRVACVWQPSAFASKRPASLYNDAMRLFGMREFNPVALDFFRARKRLLVQLVLSHGLNVLHLDADVAVLANPYPLFKGPLLEHQLIFQTDNPFANAGVFYVQGVARGSGGAWLLEELNARIERFTFRPESVCELPHSGWSAPPHFANADEQANLNDVIASALIGERTFAAGVEFFEARFKAQFAPGHCWKAGAASYGSAECVSAREGKQRLGSPRYQAETHRARRSLRGGGGAGGGGRGALRKVAHLCRGGGGGGGSRVGSLGVPGNASAPRSSLYLASESTFSHFPYGAFFPQMRGCHDASWRWEARSELERRMCAPEHRVPCLLVHMAGLRQEQWGRRALLRSLKIWRPEADAVAPAAWLSPRAFAAAGARSPEERRRAWGGEAAGRLLVTEGVRTSFASMGEYDRFAARLLLLGLLLRRRVVMPPIPCELKWMQRALEPRHLRGMDVGCGDQCQCIWLPYPHHIDPWCAGIDYLNDIDYRDLLARRLVAAPTAGATLSTGSLKLARNGSGPAVRLASGAPPPDEPQVLLMRAPAGGTSDPFEAWLPLGGFKGRKWQAPLPVLVNAALRAPPPAGLGASDAQMKIVQDCMRSLATSRE